MSVVPVNQANRTSRLQGRWDRRDVAELSHTNFKTAVRGFDRDEVRAVLDSIAADYRVLQLQNASLQRQLTHLEAVLQDYQREHDDAASLAVTHTIERTKEEARAALIRSNAQAEEMMARVIAFARDAECRVAQFEEDRRTFRTMLVSTINEMITILGRYEYRMDPLVLDLPLPPRALEAPIVHTITDITNTGASSTEEPPATTNNDSADADEGRQIANADAALESDAIELPQTEPAPVEKTPSLTLVPMPSVDRDTERRTDDTWPVRSASTFEFRSDRDNATEPMRAILKNLDKALGHIPALAAE